MKTLTIEVGQGLKNEVYAALKKRFKGVKHLGFDDTSTAWRFSVRTNLSPDKVQDLIWEHPGLSSISVSVW